MPNNVDQAVARVLGTGLEHASEAEILQHLDAELQQQASARPAVLGGEAAQPWVLGAEAAGGNAAQRFLSFYADAIHREICDPEKGRLKDDYRGVIGGLDLSGQIKSLVPLVLTAIGSGAALLNPAAIGALVALWLIRVGLDQWCAMPRASMAQTTANTGAAPAPIDPSVSAGAASGAAAASSGMPEQAPDVGNVPALAHTPDPDEAPTGTGSAPMPVDPSVSTGAADTEPAHVTDPDVLIDPATTSSNPDVRGET